MGWWDKGNAPWRRISQSEIRKIAAAKKRGRGGNSFSPHPFFFPPRPSGIFKNQFPDFRQKRFGFCPKGTAPIFRIARQAIFW